MASRAPSYLLVLARSIHPRALRASQFQTPTIPLSRSARGFTSCLPRLEHSIPRPPTQPLRIKPEDESKAVSEDFRSEGERPALPRRDLAYYQLSFTCIPCGHRSHHNISKQGYHKGSILITCPNCRNRHVMSDHLGIFGDRKITVEDLMREKGQLVKRGSLGEDGDVEFWPEDSFEEEPVETKGTSGS